jgi:hypothetical protein
VEGRTHQLRSKTEEEVEYIHNDKVLAVTPIRAMMQHEASAVIVSRGSDVL